MKAPERCFLGVVLGLSLCEARQIILVSTAKALEEALEQASMLDEISKYNYVVVILGEPHEGDIRLARYVEVRFGGIHEGSVSEYKSYAGLTRDQILIGPTRIGGNMSWSPFIDSNYHESLGEPFAQMLLKRLFTNERFNEEL